MTIVLVLLPLTLLLVGIAIWAFFWAVGDGQFDDMESPAYRILLDDDDWSSTPEEREAAKNKSDTAQSAGDADNKDHKTEPHR